MKRRMTILMLFVWFTPQVILPQKVITLKECYDLAVTVNALSKEKEAYSSISKINDENLSKGWLPTLDANGSFVYNSSVVDMSSALGSLPISGIASALKPLPHEQYKITVDISQVIYDGGAIKGARELEKADLTINQKQTETDLYKLRGLINGYYFNILLLARQKEQLTNWLDLTRKKISAMQSAQKNGILLKSDIDVLSAERIKLEQQLTENGIRKTALLKILSGLIGADLESSTILILPPETNTLSNELLRPELQLFDLRKEQLSAGMKVIESKKMPKAFGFASLGYGNPPGSNFFKNEFAPYYVVGAGIKWNIFDWNKAKNEKQVITLQQGILDNRKSDLTDNLKRLLESKMAEIKSLQYLVETDNELITLRKKISASVESQYENGTITATEYLNEMNSERQAVVNFEVHKINLAMAKIEYLNISGKEIE